MVLCIMHGVHIVVYGNKTVTINDLYDSGIRQPAFSPSIHLYPFLSKDLSFIRNDLFE